MLIPIEEQVKLWRKVYVAAVRAGKTAAVARYTANEAVKAAKADF